MDDYDALKEMNDQINERDQKIEKVKKICKKQIKATIADCICKQYSGKSTCKEHDGYNNSSRIVDTLKEIEDILNGRVLVI